MGNQLEPENFRHFMTSQFPSFYDVRNVINSSSKLKTHQLLNNIQSVNMFNILILYLYYKAIRNDKKKNKTKQKKTNKGGWQTILRKICQTFKHAFGGFNAKPAKEGPKPLQSVMEGEWYTFF